MHGKRVGLLEVFYLEEKPEIDEESFLKEGRKLVNAIAERLEKIIECKQIEDALKASEEEYSTLVEKGNDGIVIIQDGLLKFVNSKVTDITGYSKEELIEKPFLEYIPSEHKKITLERCKKRLKDPESVPSKYETTLISKNGDKIPVEINVSIIEHEGRFASMAIIRDITTRKQAEAALQKYAEKLKHSNELKDLFIDILRHDLLNPAGIVRGFTEVLLEMEEDDKKIQLLKTIERNNKRLIDLIETAATFAKLESIEELEFVKMDIGSIIKGVVENFGPQIEEKQMLIEFAVEGTYTANVNPAIEAVFANLLSNAIKYGPDRSRIILDILDAGDYWKVKVTDFGEGVTDEDKKLIFERFKRVDKGGIKGTGLGLAIVKRIIDLHGGSVGVDDKTEGKGSVFWVTVRKA